MTLHEAATRRIAARDESRRAGYELQREIRKAHKAGMTPTQIADEAGVSRQHVHNVLKGQQ